MATLAHPAPTHIAAAQPARDANAPRASGFEILVPLGAIYVILLVAGPFLAAVFHHAPK
jgi:hypothetical protein